MREKAGRYLTSNSQFLGCYAPFLDLDIATIGFSLPRFERFFNIFHRKVITKFNTPIAMIPTTEGGISASYKTTYIIKDLHKYIADKMSRLLIKINQRFLNKSPDNIDNPNHKELYNHARKLKVTNGSFKILKDVGILKKNVNIEDIGDEYLGRFISLAKLINYIG